MRKHSRPLHHALLLLVLLTSLIGTPVQARSNVLQTPAYNYVPGRVLVKFKPGLTGHAKLNTGIASLDQTAGQALSPVFDKPAQTESGLERIFSMQLPQGSDVQMTVKALEADPSVEYAEPDYLAYAAAMPNDPRYSEQWGLTKIGIESSWEQTQGAPNMLIAVIDSGIDLTHPDLLANLWTNPGEIPGNGLDDDNNGRVDDIHGWNFVSASANVADDNEHGTLVAGIAAARTDNTIGVAGVCGLCRILPVKVMQASGVANYSDIAAGIHYAIAKGAKVVNLSLGGYADSQTLHEAINAALAQNITVVAGAGNDNKSDPFYPAAYDGVIAVTSTNLDDTRSDSANTGPWVDVAAPGDNILSTAVGGGYSNGSGTSVAAPFVSGLAGLLLTLNPTWTPAMVSAQLVHTAENIDSLNPGYAGKLGGGRINAANAVLPSHPILTYAGYIANGVPSARPDPNSDVSLGVSLLNEWADASGITATLSTSDPDVSITSTAASYGSILTGQTGTNGTPFALHIGAVGYGHTIPLSLALSANEGSYTTTLHFTLTTRGSEEPVSGTLTTDTTWTRNKVYIVNGNINVIAGVTLTIQPGTVVKFNGNYNLNVRGKLLADGTVDLPITLIPYTTGQTWGNLLFDDTSEDAVADGDGSYLSGNILRYVTLEGAAGGVSCSSATPYLANLIQAAGGINCTLGATPLWVNDYSSLSGNFTASGQPVTLQNVTLTGTVNLPSDSQVTGSSITGRLTMGNNATILQTRTAGVTINGSGSATGLTATGTVEISGTGLLETSILSMRLRIIGSGTLHNNTILNDVVLSGSSAVSGNTISDSSVNLGNGSTMSDNIMNGGGIYAGINCTVSGNNIENARTTAIAAGPGVTLTHNRIVGGVTGISASTGVIEYNLIANTSGDGLVAGAASIRSNTFTGIGGTALKLSGAVPILISDNNFDLNSGSYDVFNNIIGSAPIHAQNNWWGTTDSAIINGRILDYYDNDQVGVVTYLPLITGPSQAAPAYVRGVTLDPASPVGIQTVNFTVQFSRAMDTASSPQIAAVGLASGNGTWATKAGTPSHSASQSVAAAHNGKVYAIGGENNGTLNVMEEYNPATNLWTSKASMPTPRKCLSAAAADNGKVYAIGGMNNSASSSNIVEEYDPTANSWTAKANMPTPRYCLGAAAANNGKIYVIGGRDGWNRLDTVEEYDPVTNTWATKTSMPTGRSDLAVVAASNGKIYAIGGWSSSGITGIVEEYDPVADTWKKKADLTIPRFTLGAASLNNGRIYVFGGGNNGYPPEVEEYIPDTNTWTIIMANMPTPRGFLGVVTASNGKIYTIGGRNDDNYYLNTVEEYTPLPLNVDVTINDQTQWLDSAHYRASYDFSTMNSKGDYYLGVSGARTTDGMIIPPNHPTQFSFEYTGETTDLTPPPPPDVLAWGDGTLTTLFARWVAEDPESGILNYRYAIGSTPGGTDVAGWTDLTNSEITRGGLNLLAGQTYYVSVKARNGSGLWSQAGVSNGVTNGNVPVPGLTRLSPTSVMVGDAGFTLTLTGTHFLPTAEVHWNGAAVPTTYVDDTHLTAEISADQLTTPKTIAISVFNPVQGGGETTTTLPFGVNAPVPGLTSLSLASVMVGDAGFTLTLTGVNFIPVSEVHWNGAALPTTYVDNTHLTAEISAEQLITPKTIAVSVFNPAPGGGETNTLPFEVNAPVPGLTSLSLTSVTVGDAGFILTLTGTHFLPTSEVHWNDAAVPTTYVDSTHLTAEISAEQLATPKMIAISVFNPAPGGGETNTLPFLIRSPVPSLTDISSTSAVVGDAGFTLTLTGSNFIPVSEVHWNGAALATTYVDSTHLTAEISTDQLTTAKKVYFSVFNPAPGGGETISILFTIYQKLYFPLTDGAG
jgi:subtilisin family serine protease/N-acetylneuraminic acid mutarotase